MTSDSNRFNAYHRQARACQRAGRLNAAERIIREALRIRPESRDARYRLGVILYHKGEMARAARNLRKAVDIDPEFTEGWRRKGDALKEGGNLAGAAEAYRRAASLAPENPEVQRNLGAALHKLKEYRRAGAALREAIRLNPEDRRARHLLAAIEGKAVRQPDAGYIERLFDRFSESFDRRMNGVLNYRAPRLLRKRLKPVVRREGRFRRVLDVGCGTGLAGAAIRDLSEHITGVDVSGRMIEKARAKSVYDRLMKADAVAFLNGAGERFDLITAADVFPYMGDLEPAFRAVRNRVTRKGRFAFTTEHMREGGYKLRLSGRFAHSPDYLRALAERHGLGVEKRKKFGVRMDFHFWIWGEFYLLSAGKKQ